MTEALESQVKTKVSIKVIFSSVALLILFVQLFVKVGIIVNGIG